MPNGLRLIIHNESIDPGYYGGLAKNGMYIPTGQANDIAVKKTFTYKLGPPYNYCLKDVKSINSYDSDIYRYMIKSTNYSYRQTDCFDYCLGKELNKHLKINKIDRWTNMLQDNIGNFNDLVNEYLRLIKNETYKLCVPYCPAECDSVKYETFNSFVKFEKNNITDELITFVIYFES
jgi:hypothetical protein